MAESEKKRATAVHNRKSYWFGNRARQARGKLTFKSKFKEDTFDVGASSDPARFSKSLKAIKTYIQKTYKMPDNIVKSIQQMKRLTLAFPAKPTKATCVDENNLFNNDEYEMAKFTWKELYKATLYRKEKYTENESNAWALIYDQCSPELKNKLKRTSRYDASKKDNDVVALLMMIRSYCCQFDTLNDDYMLIIGAIKNHLYFFQKTTQANADNHRDFMAMVEIIEEYGGAGSLMYFTNMIKKELESKKIDMDKASESEMRDAKKIVRDKFLAMLMLSRANREKHGKLKHSMAENYVTGTSKYPESPEVVLHILSAYTLPPGWNRRLKQEGGVGDEGAMFVQLVGRNDSWKRNISCHNSGKKGHLEWECPNKKDQQGWRTSPCKH
jgi:hypothetical protein